MRFLYAEGCRNVCGYVFFGWLCAEKETKMKDECSLTCQNKGEGADGCRTCRAKKLKGEWIRKYVFALLLTVAGGFAGAYSFSLRGGVFANMQTGNVLKTVLSLVDGGGVAEYVFPLLTFIFGTVIAVITGRAKFAEEIILSLEICAYAACFVFFTEAEFDIYANCIISFSCALQFEFYREVCGRGFCSVMSTNNLRMAVESFTLAAKNKSKEEFKNGFFYFSFVPAFAFGVLCCALLSKSFGNDCIIFSEIIFAALLIAKFCFSGKKALAK